MMGNFVKRAGIGRVFLFGSGSFSRPGSAAFGASRAGGVETGRRPPPEAARSGLDAGEHGARLASRDAGAGLRASRRGCRRHLISGSAVAAVTLIAHAGGAGPRRLGSLCFAGWIGPGPDTIANSPGSRTGRPVVRPARPVTSRRWRRWARRRSSGSARAR
jgi:hypothetical protein